MYVFSDFLYYVLYYVIGYRKKVVRSNLKMVFPNKDERWITATQKKFYRHLCDISLEIIKFRHISEKTYKKRCTYTNAEAFEQAYERGQGVTFLIAHYCNWEYVSGGSLYLKHKSLSLYKPLSNKYFEKFFFELRSRFGVHPVPQRRILREIVKLKKEGHLIMTGYVADQTPWEMDGKEWYYFLGQPTAIYSGAEAMAKRLNDAVFYMKMTRPKRGYYNIELVPICEKAVETEGNEIIKTYFRMLEDQIKEEPAYWLWSHRRWKRKMPAGTKVKSLI